MTVLGRGLILQPVLVSLPYSQARTYHERESERRKCQIIAVSTDSGSRDRESERRKCQIIAVSKDSSSRDRESERRKYQIIAVSTDSRREKPPIHASSDNVHSE